MAVRTYQKRGQAKKPAVEVLPLPPAPLIPTLESTPPWRRRVRKGLLDYNSDEDALETSLNESSGNLDESFEDVSWKAFTRGSKQDKVELESWIEKWSKEDATRFARTVPIEWELDRQMRFAAWLQMIGIACRWEGGYLIVETTRPVVSKVGRLLSRPEITLEKENASPLPAPPKPALKHIEARLSALRLSDGPNMNVGAQQQQQRNRPRVWQHASNVQLISTPAKPRESRRSSIAPLVAMEKRISRGSVGRRTTVYDDVQLSKLQGTVEFGLILKQVLSYLSPMELLQSACTVSRAFYDASFSAANAIFAQSGNLFLKSEPYYSWYSDVEFLGEGAYKSVFKVRTPSRSRYEAVSVMDCDLIARIGDASVVKREVQAALLISELAAERVCPHVVETKRVFSLKQSPPWLNNGRNQTDGNFQFIHMELCEFGDTESHMKTLPGGVFPLEDTLICAFQMFYAMFATRKTLRLRHLDVKLLNFFLAKTDARESTYWIAPEKYVRIVNQKGLSVKLADFGTSSMDELGAKIDVRHFTTLENTPPELLIFGDVVRESFALDTFPLGLALLHLLTGAMPYEEVMASVQCPTALMDALSAVWEDESDDDFSVLRCVLRDDEDNIIYHTFYRYLVLLGRPDDFDEGSALAPGKSSVFKAAWDVLEDAVLPANSKSLKAKHLRQARKQFSTDRNQFSLLSGSNHLIARARERGRALGLFDDVLLGCLAWDPAKRPSMGEVLQSKAFQKWRVSLGNFSLETTYGNALQETSEEKDIDFA